MEKETTNINFIVGKNVMKYRKLKGYTRSELARLAGYSAPTTLYKLENGSGGISIDKLEQIADILGVPITDLLYVPKDNVSDKEKLRILSSNIIENAREIEKIIKNK
ncbi:helix-turn-helix domain-containing protein [Fusobacterium sp. PH5-44]|uniref:helix-turn-helix domain-containing protein n=1 Tax=unclassified Fusobacterium TaxID=2648384 RepID=UPI003D1A5FD2